jgi:hypothetical protein
MGAAHRAARRRREHPTDSFGFIGRFYLEKQLGHRVCQIF